VNLSSNSSAGPLLIDGTRDRIFFVDQHSVNPYIGIAPLQGPLGNLTVWLSVNYRIWGLTSYVHFGARRIYWTVPGKKGIGVEGVEGVPVHSTCVCVYVCVCVCVCVCMCVYVCVHVPLS
jgi:hypothetical protein